MICGSSLARDNIEGGEDKPCSRMVQMKSMVVPVDDPNLFTISTATPNVKLAPLPPAIKITLSALFTKFGVLPYGPSKLALNVLPGFFSAKLCRSLVKPS